MTKEIAAERVSRGASMLDRQMPGWAERINVGTLKIEGCTDCILGQVYGEFGKGAFQLLYDPTTPCDLYGLAIEYGFGADCQTPGPAMGYENLQDTWIEAIADRVAPHVKWTFREREGVGAR